MYKRKRYFTIVGKIASADQWASIMMLVALGLALLCVNSPLKLSYDLFHGYACLNWRIRKLDGSTSYWKPRHEFSSYEQHQFLAPSTIFAFTFKLGTCRGWCWNRVDCVPAFK